MYNITKPWTRQTVSFNNDSIVINYINGDKNCHKCKNGESLTKVFFKLPTKINENSKNNFTVTSNFPTNYTIRPHTNAIGIEHKTLDNPSKLEADAKKMFNSLKLKPLSIKRSVEFQGEINTNYPMKSVYANLKRNLKEYISRYSYKTNEEVTPDKIANTFYINEYNNKTDFEVYPYKNGSKVIYNATISYSIDSNGGSTLKPKDIEALHNRIKKVVND